MTLTNHDRMLLQRHLDGELDPRARLRRYLSAFCRRWYLVVLPVLAGAALGWVTTPSSTRLLGRAGCWRAT